jgi:hypothetical protein
MNVGTLLGASALQRPLHLVLLVYQNKCGNHVVLSSCAKAVGFGCHRIAVFNRAWYFGPNSGSSHRKNCGAGIITIPAPRI